MGVSILFLLLSCILLTLPLPTAQQFCSNPANFTTNSTYGQNQNQILSSLASNATANGGFYITNFTQGSDTIYALALCRGDLTNQDCYDCVDAASRSIIVNCPNKTEAFDYGDTNNCIVQCSDRPFFSTMAAFPARIEWGTSNITANVNEYMKAFTSLFDYLKNNVTSGSNSVGKFATGESLYAGDNIIYGRMQCVPGLSSADCSASIANSAGAYLEQFYLKSGVNIITPSCIFQYQTQTSYFIESYAPPPPPPPLPVTSSPPPSTNGTPVGGVNSL